MGRVEFGRESTGDHDFPASPPLCTGAGNRLTTGAENRRKTRAERKTGAGTRRKTWEQRPELAGKPGPANLAGNRRRTGAVLASVAFAGSAGAENREAALPVRELEGRLMDFWFYIRHDSFLELACGADCSAEAPLRGGAPVTGPTLAARAETRACTRQQLGPKFANNSPKLGPKLAETRAETRQKLAEAGPVTRTSDSAETRPKRGADDLQPNCLQVPT